MSSDSSFDRLNFRWLVRPKTDVLTPSDDSVLYVQSIFLPPTARKPGRHRVRYQIATGEDFAINFASTATDAKYTAVPAGDEMSTSGDTWVHEGEMEVGRFHKWSFTTASYSRSSVGRLASAHVEGQYWGVAPLDRASSFSRTVRL